MHCDFFIVTTFYFLNCRSAELAYTLSHVRIENSVPSFQVPPVSIRFLMMMTDDFPLGKLVSPRKVSEHLVFLPSMLTVFNSGFPASGKIMETWKMKKLFPDLEKSWNLKKVQKTWKNHGI